jgi:hypothetical protein
VKRRRRNYDRFLDIRSEAFRNRRAVEGLRRVISVQVVVQTSQNGNFLAIEIALDSFRDNNAAVTLMQGLELAHAVNYESSAMQPMPPHFPKTCRCPVLGAHP